MKPDIEIDHDSITVNGTLFKEPPTIDRLSRIFGPPSDTRNITFSKTYVWQWSELGIQISGRSDTEVNTFGVFLDSNLQCSTPGLASQYTLRYTSGLHVLGLDAMQSGTIEELKRRAVDNNLYESTGGDHSTATFWFSGGKFELFPTAPEKDHIYLSEEEYTQDGKPVFYKILSFRYARKEKPAVSNPPVRPNLAPVNTQQTQSPESRYTQQPISIREDGSYSGGFRRETGAIFARWFWRVGWMFGLFFIVLICILLYLLLH